MWAGQNFPGRYGEPVRPWYTYGRITFDSHIFSDIVFEFSHWLINTHISTNKPQYIKPQYITPSYIKDQSDIVLTRWYTNSERTVRNGLSSEEYIHRVESINRSGVFYDPEFFRFLSDHWFRWIFVTMRIEYHNVDDTHASICENHEKKIESTHLISKWRFIIQMTSKWK